MEQQERTFKGIWIPKEIWLNNELTLQEKVILVEIDSLDNDDGCFASNKYFSEFFGISAGRVSQVINELAKKGFLNIKFEKKNKQIIKRIIKIQSPPYPTEVFRKLNRGYLENDDRGIKYSKGGYLENDEDNNILFNNINNNNNISSYYKIKESCEYFEEQFGRTIAPIEYEKIIMWEETFTNDIINYAIDIAVLNNKKSFNYIDGILRNWKTSNYKTLQEIKENEIKKEKEMKEEELFDYNWLEEE